MHPRLLPCLDWIKQELTLQFCSDRPTRHLKELGGGHVFGWTQHQTCPNIRNMVRCLRSLSTSHGRLREAGTEAVDAYAFLSVSPGQDLGVSIQSQFGDRIIRPHFWPSSSLPLPTIHVVKKHIHHALDLILRQILALQHVFETRVPHFLHHSIRTDGRRELNGEMDSWKLS